MIAILVGTAYGQAAEEPIADAGARVEQIADGVYVILHDDATDEWPHGNTGVIVGKKSVLVIDSTYLPSRSRDDIALIRRITDKPVVYLATTHWHFDHNNGAISYRAAFPELSLIAERDTARWLELNQIWWSKMSTAPDSPRRAGLANLEAELIAGVAGQLFGAQEQLRREEVIARRRAELLELETLVTVTPDHLFDDDLQINLGGMKVELHDWGRANSPADVTVLLPKQRILFTGDILVQTPLPFVGACWPVPWVEVLGQIDALDVDIVVPGHGPVMRDHVYLRQVREVFAGFVSRVEGMVREGKTLDQIQATLDVDDLRASVPVWQGTPDEDWAYIRTTLIERAWRGIRGQG